MQKTGCSAFIAVVLITLLPLSLQAQSWSNGGRLAIPAQGGFPLSSLEAWQLEYGNPSKAQTAALLTKYSPRPPQTSDSPAEVLSQSQRVLKKLLDTARADLDRKEIRGALSLEDARQIYLARAESAARSLHYMITAYLRAGKISHPEALGALAQTDALVTQPRTLNFQGENELQTIEVQSNVLFSGYESLARILDEGPASNSGCDEKISH
jgi:hypothetical protein